jgi:hypothetical protein
MVPALPCCWAHTEPQSAIAATVIMMPVVFIGLSRFLVPSRRHNVTRHCRRRAAASRPSAVLGFAEIEVHRRLLFMTGRIPHWRLAASSLERDFCRRRLARQKGPEGDVSAQRPEIVRPPHPRNGRKNGLHSQRPSTCL